MVNVHFKSWNMGIEVCLSFNFAVVSNFNVFSFPPSKVEINRRCPPHDKTKCVNYIFLSDETRAV